MDCWTTILAILTIGLVYYLIKRKNYFQQLGIPYEPYLPIVGSMGSCFKGKLSGIELLHSFYKKNSEAKYFGFYDFHTPVIMIRDPEIIKSITIKNFENFLDHRVITDAGRDPLFGNTLFSLEGDKWRDTRALLSPSFTSSKMKMMFHLITECALDFTNLMIERCKDQGYVVNMKEIITRLTADTISSCAFGIKIDSIRDPDNELYVLGRKSTDFEGPLSMRFFLSRSFYHISKLIGVKLISESATRFFTDVISSNVKARREKGITRPDFLQLMMEAKDKNKGQGMTSQEMTAHAFSFFFGGLDTVSTQLCFIAHEITINPEVQVRLQEEIDAVLENCKGEPSYSDIINMPYLDAVVNEAMRLYPGGVFLDRVCKKEFELPPPLPGKDPVVLKPGANVMIPVFPIHHDSNYYEDPEMFKPERFLGDNKVHVNAATFLPFGIGPRMCIANRFALMEMKVILFHLLSKCNFRVCSKTTNPICLKKDAFGLLPEGGFWLKFELRDSIRLD